MRFLLRSFFPCFIFFVFFARLGFVCTALFGIPGSDSLVRAEEDSTAVTNENGHISSEKNLKKDRRESIRNQILTLDVNDEDFFQNVMKVLSAIDEPELRQYVIVISELVTMEMDDGKTVREKLRDVELNINRLQVDIKEIKEMLVTLINK